MCIRDRFDSHEDEGPDFSDINLMKPKEIKSFLDVYKRQEISMW